MSFVTPTVICMNGGLAQNELLSAEVFCTRVDIVHFLSIHQRMTRAFSEFSSTTVSYLDL